MVDTPMSDPASMIAASTPPRSPNMPDQPAEPEPTADQDTDEGQYVEFPIPEGFQPPADGKPGKTFQALATLKIDEDGKSLCLVAVDGAAVKPGDSESEEPEGEEQPEATPGPAPTTAQQALQQGLPKTGIPA
jgi:hypothetical protein